MFCEIYLQSATACHITTILDLFIYFIFIFFYFYFFIFFFLTDPRFSIPNSRSSILDPHSRSSSSPVNLELLLIKTVLFFFFDH